MNQDQPTTIKKQKEKRPLTKFQKLLLTMLHGIFLLFLCFFAASIPYSFDSELHQIKLSSLIKSVFVDNESFSDQFLLIDVSKNKQVIELPNNLGNVVVTDRKKLTELFSIVNKQDQLHKHIVCDILFDIPSKLDAPLEKELNATKNLLVPFSKKENRLILPIFKKVPQAYSGYGRSSGAFSTESLLKYELLPEQSIKTIPIFLYEDVVNVEASKGGGFLWIENEVYFNNVIYNPRIDTTVISDGRKGSNVYPLNEVLGLLKKNAPIFYPHFFAGKHVFIGDFEFDIHRTSAGVSPGTLILANLFLGLEKGDNRITLGWTLFVLLMFCVLSWGFFFGKKWIVKIEDKLKLTGAGHLLLTILSTAVMLWIISFLSFCVFNKHVDISFITLYFSLVLIIKKNLNTNPL